MLEIDLPTSLPPLNCGKWEVKAVGIIRRSAAEAWQWVSEQWNPTDPQTTGTHTSEFAHLDTMSPRWCRDVHCLFVRCGLLFTWWMVKWVQKSHRSFEEETKPYLNQGNESIYIHPYIHLPIYRESIHPSVYPSIYYLSVHPTIDASLLNKGNNFFFLRRKNILLPPKFWTVVRITKLHTVPLRKSG